MLAYLKEEGERGRRVHRTIAVRSESTDKIQWDRIDSMDGHTYY